MNISGIKGNLSRKKLKENKVKNNNRGITLIALIITIIVLLILAGISISLVVGQNGVLTRSQQASTRTKESQAQEAFELAFAALETDYHQGVASGEITSSIGESDWITLKMISDNLSTDYKLCDKNGTVLTDLTQTVKSTESTGIYMIKDGQVYKVTYQIISGVPTNIVAKIYDKSSEVTPREVVATIIKKDGSKIEIYKDSSNDEIKEIAQQVYGEAVDYHPSTDPDGVYRIFYIEDQDNKYQDGVGTIYLKRDYDSNSLINLYRNIDNNPSENTINLMKKLMPQWSDKGEGFQYENSKAVAYLYDITKWSQYLVSDKVNYIIGSPSLEIYISSYNDVEHNIGSNKLESEYESLGYQCSGTIDYAGYNSMYVCPPNTGWALASPAPGYSYGQNICSVGYSQDPYEYFVSLGSDGYDWAFCPLVSLKQGITLTIE